eukprot:641158-Pleurochrysis_carterae.AAC.1
MSIHSGWPHSLPMKLSNATAHATQRRRFCGARRARAARRGLGLHDWHVHVRVHGVAHQAERERLRAHESLVVALAVGEQPLVRAAVAHGVDHAAELELRVGRGAEHLGPHRRDGHGLPVREADAALLDRHAEAGEARVLLGDGDERQRSRVRGNVVCELQVDEPRLVNLGGRTEVALVVAAKRAGGAEAPVAVERGGGGVKAEAVDAVCCRPPDQVGQQEADNFQPRKVKDARAPHGVMARGAREEVWTCHFILRQPLARVGRSMRMDHLNKHDEAEPMRFVDEPLQLVCRPEARRRCKVRGHLRCRNRPRGIETILCEFTVQRVAMGQDTICPSLQLNK